MAPTESDTIADMMAEDAAPALPKTATAIWVAVNGEGHLLPSFGFAYQRNVLESAITLDLGYPMKQAGYHAVKATITYGQRKRVSHTRKPKAGSK